MNKSVEDCLIVSVDFSPNDKDCLVVARKSGDKTHVINVFKDEEAVDIYNKLIGNVEKRCATCRYYQEAYSSCYCNCIHSNNFGYFMSPYETCNDYKRK